MSLTTSAAARPSEPPCAKAAGRTGMIYIPPETVVRMRAQLTTQTNVAISATFGISQNTWVKIRAGEPIRRSVGERLLARLASGRAPEELPRRPVAPPGAGVAY